MIKSKRNHSISSDLIRLILIFIVTPTLITTTLLVVMWQGHLKNDASMIQHQRCERLATVVSAYINGISLQLGETARFIGYKNLTREDIRLILNRIISDNSSIESLTIAYSDGREYVKVSRYYSYRDSELKDIYNNSLFLEAISGREYYGVLHMSEFSRTPVMSIALPIYSKNNSIVGVLESDINVAKFWNLIAREAKSMPGTEIYIVDDSGNLLAYKDISQVLSKKENVRSLPIVREFLSGKTGSLVYKGISGKMVLGDYALIPQAKLAVIIEYRLVYAYRLVYHLSLIMLVLVFITLLFAGVSGYKLTYNLIIGPIKRLQDAFSEIRKSGALDKEIEIKRDDEIGLLSKGFNETIRQLRETTVSRNELIKEMERRKTSEEALKESERWFRTAAQQTGQMIYDYDIVSGEIKWAGAINSVTGFTDDEFRNADVYDWGQLLHPDDREKALMLLIECIANNTPYFTDYRIRRKDGKYIVVEDDGVFLNNAEGKPVRLIGVMRDITARRQSERALHEAYQQLKDTQYKLVQSSKMAAIGQLASGVAHEINNPLTGVLNNVQLIKLEVEKSGKGDIKDYIDLLDVIENSALRCKKITQSLLNFSHVSKRNLQPFSVNYAIEETATLIQHELKLQNITIKLNLEDGLPDATGEAQLFQQVIYDLIVNAQWAIKMKKSQASEFKEGLISISTGFLKEENGIAITLEDNGIGISKDNLPRIFEPFFTTKPVGEGTGLGLSIVYSIIKEHNGSIEVSSRENKGTTFRIIMPAKKG